MSKSIVLIALLMMSTCFSSNSFSREAKKPTLKVLASRVNLYKQEVFPGNYFGISIITLFNDGSEVSSLNKKAKYNLNDYEIEFEGPVVQYARNKEYILLKVEGELKSKNIVVKIHLKENSEIKFSMKIPIRFDIDYDINLSGNGGKTGQSFFGYHSNDNTISVSLDVEVEPCHIEVLAQGHHEEKGKNGKDGKSGSDALNAEIYVSQIELNELELLKIEIRRSDSQIFYRYLSMNEGSFIIDARGGNGGHGGNGADAEIGGDGGSAGNGGNGGNISYYFTNDTWQFKDQFYVFNPGGKAGIAGRGGDTCYKGLNGSSAKDGLKGSRKYVLLEKFN